MEGLTGSNGSLCKPPHETQQVAGAVPWSLASYWTAACSIRRQMRSCPFPSVLPTAEDDDHDPAFPCIASHCIGLLLVLPCPQCPRRSGTASATTRIPS